MKFLAVATRRSGHHAVLNWMCHQLSGGVVWSNNVDLNLITGELNIVEYGEKPHAHSLINIETPHPDHVKTVWSKFKPDYLITIHRDVYNWGASSWKRGWNPLEPHHKPMTRRMNTPQPTCMENYISYMRHALGDECLIDDPYKCLMINYDLWFMDNQYRREIIEGLGCEFTDHGFSEVIDFGEGSSFDGLKFDGNGDKMSVLERWRDIDDPYFPHIFSEEVVDLSDRFFRGSNEKIDNMLNNADAWIKENKDERFSL